MRAFLSFANTGPCPLPLALRGPPPSPLASLRRRKGGGPGVGGASRSHSRLCPPPRPTLPRDRKAEPRLPGPPPPLLAAAVWGWWRLSFFAWDGRGCRYGDRSVGLGAAGFREQTCPGPRHLLLLPARTLCRPHARRGWNSDSEARGSCSGWKGEGSLAFPESGLFADLFPHLLVQHRPPGPAGLGETHREELDLFSASQTNLYKFEIPSTHLCVFLPLPLLTYAHVPALFLLEF